MASSRVGVDIEVIDMTVAPDAVLTHEESYLGGGPVDFCSWWSAKEALAKALGDARKYDPRRLASAALWQLGRQGRWQAKRLDVPTGHVGWVVWETELAC
jgi:phosphopantetheinyl transferase